MRRVAIARGGALLPASDAWMWRAGDTWAPAPPEREDLTLADATRPTGVHPAHWYGVPRGSLLPQTLWVVTVDGTEHVVRALSAAGAVHSLHMEVRDVDSIVRMEEWY